MFLRRHHRFDTVRSKLAAPYISGGCPDIRSTKEFVVAFVLGDPIPGTNGCVGSVKGVEVFFANGARQLTYEPVSAAYSL